MGKSQPGSSESKPAREAGQPEDHLPDHSINIFDSLPQEAKFSITSPELPVEIAHRHHKEDRDQMHRQRLEVFNWVSTLGLIVVLGIVWTVVYFQSPDPDIRKLALGGLTSLLTAWLGFIAGRSSGKSG
jgi:hypothetical protein